MKSIARLPWACVEFFGAHRVSDVELHEADRALQRAVVCIAVSSVWALQSLNGHAVHAGFWLVLSVGLIYPAFALTYRRFVLSHPGPVSPLVYLFLVLDPIALTAVLFEDPQTFAFLNPFLFFIVVRVGIRYGVRTMYLAWSVTLIAVALLPTSAYWRAERELTFALLLMLLFVPLLFARLVRRIHNVRAIEADRARFSAAHDAVVARSSFISKVSHELRSPLQGIVSALDVLELRGGHAEGADQELIRRIRRSSLLLNTHLRDLLTLARGDAGRLEVRPEPFEACALVEGVVSAAAELAFAKDLKLCADLPPDAVFVVADGARIDQILTNLVINSIRYTTVGQVRLSMRPYDPGTRLLRFAVADTGPGIPADVLPTLLAPDRMQTGAERRGEGSGIGLAIVRTLVDHLGGRVEVASMLGQGTTFTIEIPAEPVIDAQAAAEHGGATGRVLVVDDREDVLDALGSVVDELGFECDRALSAAVGANLLASRPYDIALLDLEMPLKGGAALAADTRNGQGPNRATRFVAMSASIVGQDVRHHFDAFITKPIDRAALRHVLLSVGPSSRPSQPGLWSDKD